VITNLEKIIMDEIVEMAKYMAETKSEEEYQEWVSERTADKLAEAFYADLDSSLKITKTSP
jgi:hypothetical protein